MAYLLSQIGEIVGGQTKLVTDIAIHHLLVDSRKWWYQQDALFFALKTNNRDGHFYIAELYKQGLKNFVTEHYFDTTNFPDANFIIVKNTLEALQQLAAWHRRQFHIPVIAITGSNGKTIVKEWLFQCLQSTFNVVRSPKSYNSQIGVPLSIWQMNSSHQLAIIEAGISQPGEMENLEEIILPDIGILTNLGQAHDEYFLNQEQKLTEKLKLFEKVQQLIYNESDDVISEAVLNTYPHLFANKPTVEIAIVTTQQRIGTSFRIQTANENFEVNIPFSDEVSIKNAAICIKTLLVLNYPVSAIIKGMAELQPVQMRLQMLQGINHCTIINDAYNADLQSLEMALAFLKQHSGNSTRIVILSDMMQTGIAPDQLYNRVALMLNAAHLNKVITVGKESLRYLPQFLQQHIAIESFENIEECKAHLKSHQFKDAFILVKGARQFMLEHIVKLLEQKTHQTILQINLQAIADNLKTYKNLLQPATKIMVMVKAFAYGSGIAEVAGVLQFNKADYLGVAYVDEGIALRKAGIHLPVMVMNTEPDTFSQVTEYGLEPVLYNQSIGQQFYSFLEQQGVSNYPVHIEIETGMNRLGWNFADLHYLHEMLNVNTPFKIQSVFSHLASGEDKNENAFSLMQYQRLMEAAKAIETMVPYGFMKHIANSAAMTGIPDMQLDMTRLGIGLYGISYNKNIAEKLRTVATLTTNVAQIKYLEAGETVGYNRAYMADKKAVIAVVRIGYADGFPRSLGNGIGFMMVKGKKAFVAGKVCMDMTMLDITGIADVVEGDPVEVFGSELKIEILAEAAGTIPYEIMTGISQRVKRIYFEE